MIKFAPSKKYSVKKIISIALITLLFSNCKPIQKVELPYTGGPPNIVYTKSIISEANKNLNFDNVMKKFIELNPENKIVNDDKFNSYFQIIGYSFCKYKNHQRKFSYLLSYQGEDKKCDLVISHIKLGGVRLESYYVKNSHRTLKKLNPSYEDINNQMLVILNELTKQIK